MKKSVFFVFALCLLAACSQKEIASDKAVSSSPAIYASIENSTTRTFIDDQLNVCWNAEDWIVVFNKDTYGACYIFDGNDGDTSGSFTISPSDEGETNDEPLPYVYAAYPYDYYDYVEDGAILAWLCPEQEFTEGSFDPYTNVMVAASEDETLAFKNAVGILKVRLYGDSEVAIKSVTIQGNNGEFISGDAFIAIAPGEEPEIEIAEDDYVYDYCSILGEYDWYSGTFGTFNIGGSESEPVDLYFLVYPTKFEDGITITVEPSKGQAFTYTSKKPLEIKRSVITATAPLEIVFPEPEDIEPVPVPYFEDFESEPENWSFLDIDGDGFGWAYVNSVSMSAHSGSGILTSASYDNNYGVLTPDNWAISVPIQLTAGNYLSFYVCAQDPKWKSEHYAVYISDDISGEFDVNTATKLYEATFEANGYEKIILQIPAAFDNKAVRIAFRHFNCTDMYMINIDDVAVTEEEPEPEEPEEPEPVDPLQAIYTVSDYAGALTMEELTGTNWDFYGCPFDFDSGEWVAERDYLGPAVIKDIEDVDDEDLITISGLSYVYGDIFGFDDSVVFDLYGDDLVAIYSHITENGSFDYGGEPLYVRTEYLDAELNVYNTEDDDYWIAGIKVADGIIALICPYTSYGYNVNAIGYFCYNDPEYTDLYSPMWYTSSILLVDSSVYPTPDYIQGVMANNTLNRNFKGVKPAMKALNVNKKAESLKLAGDKLNVETSAPKASKVVSPDTIKRVNVASPKNTVAVPARVRTKTSSRRFAR